MLGGEEEKDPDAAKKEEERQEALRQQEEERKAKHARMEAEREKVRQTIRDKVRIHFWFHVIEYYTIHGNLLVITSNFTLLGVLS